MPRLWLSYGFVYGVGFLIGYVPTQWINADFVVVCAAIAFWLAATHVDCTTYYWHVYASRMEGLAFTIAGFAAGVMIAGHSFTWSSYMLGLASLALATVIAIRLKAQNTREARPKGGG